MAYRLNRSANDRFPVVSLPDHPARREGQLRGKANPVKTAGDLPTRAPQRSRVRLTGGRWTGWLDADALDAATSWTAPCPADRPGRCRPQSGRDPSRPLGTRTRVDCEKATLRGTIRTTVGDRRLIAVLLPLRRDGPASLRPGGRFPCGPPGGTGSAPARSPRRRAPTYHLAMGNIPTGTRLVSGLRQPLGEGATARTVGRP